jgi:CubicO group peptidase (beta-lactamase class C family)
MLGVSDARANGPPPQAVPETVGMSSERLQKIDAALRAEVEKGRLPGAVLAIARRGKLVHFQSYGRRVASSARPASE